MASPYLGQIAILPWNWAPRGWALCNGAIIPIQQNSALFALLGTTYGGNGTSTFGLPNLQSRVAVHFGTANYGETFVLGETAGVENVTINTSTMPAHTHSFGARSDNANTANATNHLLATDTATNVFFYGPASNVVTLNPGSVSMAGGSQAHTNIQPYLALNYCIATSGVFPPRN